MNGVRMWLDRGEENPVVFLLFSYYMQKLQEWFALLFALLVIPILAGYVHFCVYLEKEPYIIWSCWFLLCSTHMRYCLTVILMIFFIRIIREKFKFTSHAHSWSLANIIVLCRLGSINVVFLSYYYRERNKLKWKIYMIRPFPNKNWWEFQIFYIRPYSAVHSAQWDLDITMGGAQPALKQFAFIFDDVSCIYHHKIWHAYNVNC